MRVVRQFLGWCRTEGEEVTGTPQLPRLPKRVVDVLSREEIDRLENAAPTERDKLIIRILADTGIRVGELGGLTAQRRHRRPGPGRLPRGPGVKGRRSGWCRCRPACRLDRYRRARPLDARGDRLFLAARRNANGDYAPLTTSGILQLLRSAAERAGMTRRVHPHLFRHAFATEALRRGMNPVQLAQLLGHSGLRMIEQVYAHLNAADGYEAVMKMLTADR